MQQQVLHEPTEEDKEAAQKFARFVMSALQYDDVPTAVKNLKLALTKLTGLDY